MSKNSNGWHQKNKLNDLKTRHEIRVCRDGRRRNSLRCLTPEEQLERFMSRVEKLETGCWKWTGGICGSSSQYGQFHKAGKLMKAHRWSYEHFVGPIPKGLVTRHTCDYKLCVNPDHILIGTQQDNINDKVERGRHRFGVHIGEKNPRSKITESQVLQVMELKRSGIPEREIAIKTGVSKTNVGAIVQGRTWRHVTGLNIPRPLHVNHDSETADTKPRMGEVVPFKPSEPVEIGADQT